VAAALRGQGGTCPGRSGVKGCLFGARGGAEVGWVRQLHSTGPTGMRLGWGRGCGKAACGQAAGTCNGVQERGVSRSGWRVPAAPRPSGQAVRPFRPRRSAVGRLGHGGRAAAVACVACHRQSGGGCARPRAPGGAAAGRRRRAVGPRHLPEHRAAVPRPCLRVPPGIRIDPHGTDAIHTVKFKRCAARRRAAGLCRRWGSRGRLLWPRPAGGPR
jgi:hypothetical protein